MALQETFVAAMKATQDVRVAMAARQEAAVDARKAMEVAVKASDTIREVLEAVRASKESAHAELDSQWSEAVHACDSVLGAPLNRARLISRFGGISGQLERAVADGSFFEVQTMLSVVISHYDGINLPSII
jgi:hypothetical protein